MTMQKKIYLSPPSMKGDELDYIVKAYNSNWIAPVGPDVDEFERDVAKYLSVSSGCALSSGTAALHLALKVLEIKKNDKVLCPSLTFAATANSILYEKATPIFIDVSPKYWTIDIESLEQAIIKYKPRAIITVDLYGESCNYDDINFLCNKYKVAIIEDAAEALGSEYKNKKTGSFGSINILSFNGNKIITTSGGGMLLSNNDSYVKKAKFLSTQAKEPVLHYEHKELGYNYRLSNLLASLGRAQLSHLNEFVKKRRDIFRYYTEALKDTEGIDFIQETEGSRSNHWLTVMTIDPNKSGTNRDKIIKELNMENIESRPVWKPMHMQPFYKKYDYISLSGEDISKKLFSNGICLPSGSFLQKNEQNKIIEIILKNVS